MQRVARTRFEPVRTANLVRKSDRSDQAFPPPDVVLNGSPRRLPFNAGTSTPHSRRCLSPDRGNLTPSTPPNHALSVHASGGTTSPTLGSFSTHRRTSPALGFATAKVRSPAALEQTARADFALNTAGPCAGVARAAHSLAAVLAPRTSRRSGGARAHRYTSHLLSGCSCPAQAPVVKLPGSRSAHCGRGDKPLDQASGSGAAASVGSKGTCTCIL